MFSSRADPHLAYVNHYVCVCSHDLYRGAFPSSVKNLLVIRERAFLKLDFHQVTDAIDAHAKIRSSLTNIAKIKYRSAKLTIASHNITVIPIALAILPHRFTWSFSSCTQRR